MGNLAQGRFEPGRIALHPHQIGHDPAQVLHCDRIAQHFLGPVAFSLVPLDAPEGRQLALRFETANVLGDAGAEYHGLEQ